LLAGVTPLSAAQGLALLDAALSRPELQLVPILLSLDASGRSRRPGRCRAVVCWCIRACAGRRQEVVTCCGARAAGCIAGVGTARCGEELLQGEIACSLAGPSAVPIDRSC
jgi:hypothetical protein